MSRGSGAPRDDGPPHFRRLPRQGREAALRYHLVEGDAPGAEGTATTRNVSAGGAFVETAAPLPPGSLLHLVLELPDGPLELAAEVRWIAPATSQGAGGMGVRFTWPDHAAVERIEDWLAAPPPTVDHDDETAP